MSRLPLVDLSNSEPEDAHPNAWDEVYWIRPHNPRIYPLLDVPKVVSDHRALLLSYPPECTMLLPTKTLPVSSLLKDWLGSPSPRQSLIDTGLHFDDAHPDPNCHAILNVLRVRSTIPPLNRLLDLEQRFGQAWFDGKHSIIDSYYTKVPLPFWVITLWKDYHHLFGVRSQWLSAEEVIRSASSRDPDIDYKIRKEADCSVSSLQQVAWCAPICGFPSGGWRPNGLVPLTPSSVALTTEFLPFFQDKMLNDEAINMMLHCIRLDVQHHSSLHSSVVIADLVFTQHLLRVYSCPSPKYSRTPLLDRYTSLFSKLGRTKLFFIVNSGGDHWVALSVDFDLRVYSYGDSLAGTRAPNQPAISALTLWLKHSFPRGFDFTPTSDMRCERQKDGWSCGIAACTMISSQLGFDPPWSPATARLMRLTWANRALKTHISA
ncbi:hypothetical protein FRC11_004662 [Ceratobasidium sp. 423]|nr:hypothetical protein FRC11_004662 [Ceratobasidium sp. 423]